jgi:hypothetical protein
MKPITTVVLMLIFTIATLHAQQRPVSLTFSGTSTDTTLNLQSGANTGEENFAGNGTFGPFTYLELQAGTASPQPSSTCSGATLLYFPIVTGAGVFRFQNGSLLTVRITEGATCVDLTVPVGHVTVTYQVTGGTGIYKGASGTLILKANSLPVLFDSANSPVLFAVTGELTGTVAF